MQLIQSMLNAIGMSSIRLGLVPEPCLRRYMTQAFDDLLLLKRGGLVIYMGSLGERSIDLVEYFQSISGVPPIKEGLNPATWMLEISTLTQEERIGVDFAECYSTSELYRCVSEMHCAEHRPC